MSAAPLLELTGVCRYYQSGDTVVRALDEVSLAVWPGEFVAIMGQSGSGKSTLMNIIGCLDRATAGTYSVLGQDVARLGGDELAALRRDVFGFVFQRYNLLATATAEENVEIPAVYAGLPKFERASRAHALLTRLGLGDRGGHRPSQLSGGQQQRVALARALMNDPPVILADEPTGALDSRSGVEVMTWLRQLHAEGRTIILITHDENIAAQTERILHIHDGRLQGVPDPVAPRARETVLPPRGMRKPGTLVEIAESAKMALRSLRVNLFRTALTLLGIVIGVASVVTMLAIGSGSNQKVLEQITAMGTNLLTVRPGAPGIRGSGDVVTMTTDDAEAIIGIPNVELVLPERSGRYPLRYGNIDYQSTATGVWPSMTAVREWPLRSGAFFTDRDLLSYAPVAVLGQTVAQRLFPEGDDPLGHYVLIRNTPFEVIGVLTPKGASSWGGQDQDDAVFIPLTTGLIRLFGGAYVNGITVKVAAVERIEETQDRITKLLIERHRAEDFSLRNMASLLETATATQETLTVMLGAVAAISLLVGGIGVMNIMLVSVTERTREIGIRVAAGARKRDILLQFNTEAAVVCTIGGLLGVAAGFFAGWVLRLFEVAVAFSVTPAILAFSCAFGTGLLFGYLPARTAANLDPVVALASE